MDSPPAQDIRLSLVTFWVSSALVSFMRLGGGLTTHGVLSREAPRQRHHQFTVEQLAETKP